MLTAVILSCMLLGTPSDAEWATMPHPAAVEAEFRQEKTSPAFRKPLVSYGKVLVVKPGRLRLEYTKPARSTVIVDGERLLMAHPGLGTTQSLDLKTQPELRATFLGLLAVFETNLNQLDSTFVVVPATTDRMVLHPKSDALKAFVQKVILVIDLKRGVLREVELLDPKGGRTHFVFSNVNTNPKISKSAFQAP